MINVFLLIGLVCISLVGCGKRYSKPAGDYIAYQIDTVPNKSYTFDGVIQLNGKSLDSNKIDSVIVNKVSANLLGQFFFDSNFMVQEKDVITFVFYNLNREMADGDGPDHEKIARLILFSKSKLDGSLIYGIETEFMEGMCCHSISPIENLIEDDEFYNVGVGRTKNRVGRDSWSYTDSDIVFTILKKHNLKIDSDFEKLKNFWNKI